MKLFRVQVQGSQFKPAYVLAEDSGKAYEQVREMLDRANYGFERERGMKSVELVAENTFYPECGCWFMSEWMPIEVSR